METGAAPVVVVGRQGSFVEEEMGRDGRFQIESGR